MAARVLTLAAGGEHVLRITISMVPQGMEGDAYELGRAEIWNDCKGSATKGDYGARLRGGYVGWGGKGVWKRGQVVAFPRKARGAWDLLYRALGTMIGDRNPAPAGSVLGAAVAALNGRAAVESVRIVMANLRAAYTDEYPAHKATAELCADVLLAAAPLPRCCVRSSRGRLRDARRGTARSSRRWTTYGSRHAPSSGVDAAHPALGYRRDSPPRRHAARWQGEHPRRLEHVPRVCAA